MIKYQITNAKYKISLMKKFFAILVVGLLAALNCQAQEEQQFKGIDHVNIAQEINFDTCHVCIVPTVNAEKKDNKKVKDQEIAFAELGKTLLRELKVAFRDGTYEVIADAKDAPAGAVVVEACLDEIDWGSGFKRQTSFGVGGKIAASYGVKVSNGKGLVLEFSTIRSHATHFQSALGPDVIRVYNRVIAEDLITILRSFK